MRELVIAAALSLLACRGTSLEESGASGPPLTPSVTTQLGEEFRLGFGQTAAVRGTNVTVFFRDVLEDSRCPEDVVCVWAGNARIQLRVSDGRSMTDLALGSNEEPREGLFHAHRLELLSLTGPGRAGVKKPDIEYFAVLRVTAS